MASVFRFAKVCGHSNNHEGRMSDNRYAYEGREDLTPGAVIMFSTVRRCNAVAKPEARAF
ncbi:hypothetical protein [Burkholderia sola]|uniref:hypothetical protein n=1 Tax=Burkholderia sola TaxID=2843302 RepID=UPI0023DDFBE8|nr:hypothetical protein [Burkholderia sola]MDF3085176.1 hypothetical protein [Burkholderia sola]